MKLKTHPANLQEIVYYRFKSDFFRQDRKNSQMGKATTLKRLVIINNN
jgi:hypothetical protein